MPIDPNIILQAGNYPRLDVGQMYGTALGLIGQRDAQDARRQQGELVQRQIAREDRTDAAAAAKEQRRATLGTMAAGGDVEGARAGALQAGDTELAATFAGLDDDKRKLALDKIKGASSLFGALSQVPATMRKQAAMGMAEQFGIYGVPPEKLGTIDYSDNGLALLANQALSRTEQLLQQNNDRTYAQTVAQFGETRRHNRAGEVLATAQFGETRRHNRAGEGKDSALKALPPAAQAGMIGNDKTLKQIDAAIAALNPETGRPQSIGVGTGWLGDTATQFNDPGGTDTRASVAQIGAAKIHDLSGAAAPASEMPRYTPFVPKVDDRPEIALAKLQKMRALVVEEQETMTGYYNNPQNGFRAYQNNAPAAPAAPKLPAGGGVMKPGGSGVPPAVAAALARAGIK